MSKAKELVEKYKVDEVDIKQGYQYLVKTLKKLNDDMDEAHFHEDIFSSKELIRIDAAQKHIAKAIKELK
jgi:hypothetical protein